MWDIKGQKLILHAMSSEASVFLFVSPQCICPEVSNKPNLILKSAKMLSDFYIAEREPDRVISSMINKMKWNTRSLI